MDENKNSHRKITMSHTQTNRLNSIALCACKKETHPDEIGALAKVFEKSATDLKLKQNLLKCKCTIQIVTFNIRNLNRIGQLLELTASAIDHNMDIIYLQENRCTHSCNITDGRCRQSVKVSRD